MKKGRERRTRAKEDPSKNLSRLPSHLCEKDVAVVERRIPNILDGRVIVQDFPKENYDNNNNNK